MRPTTTATAAAAEANKRFNVDGSMVNLNIWEYCWNISIIAASQIECNSI